MRSAVSMSAVLLLAACSSGSSDSIPASSTPRHGSGMLAVWDTCGSGGPTTLVDPMNGVATGNVALTGHPSRSPVSGAGDRTFPPVSYSNEVAWSLDSKSIVSGSNPIVRVDLATGVIAPLGPQASGSLLPTLDWG